MRKPLPHSARPLAGAICLVAACLAGCASKNPLIDEPSAPAASAAKAAEPTATEAKPAVAESGVATTGPSRARRLFGFLTPYRIDVQQGNFISREMVNQLKEGMRTKDGVTPEQVRFVLGTPLLTDIFHANRWDYAFRLKKGNGEIISSRVTVFFKDNRLVSIDGGILPTEQEYLALIAGSAPAQSNK
ncbi:MAG TPA: outer membrane protein assembly factor BamE [Noviherbaspirillum sp.]|nr:outer membrane protein assembly factor BamE [Noviherbaspirillum sp.]